MNALTFTACGARAPLCAPRFAKRVARVKLFPMQLRDGRARAAKSALALAKWALRLAALYFLAMWVSRTVLPAVGRTDTRRDMVLYYRAAQSAADARPLYRARPDYGPDSKPFEYLYPPPFAALIAPLGALRWEVFARAWTVALLLLFLVYAAALMRLGGRCDVWSFVLALAAIAVTLGARRALMLGQIDPLLWALTAWSVWLAPRKSPSSGALLGVGSLVKIYAVWPLLAVQKREQPAHFWRGALLVGLSGLLLGALVCGPNSYAQWARAVLPEAAQGTFNPDNYSLSMAGLRAARWLGWNYAGGPLTGWPKWWLSGFAVAGPLLAALGTRRLELRARLALVSCAAAWCAPLCWTTYLPLALVPLALGWAAIARRFQARRFQARRFQAPPTIVAP